MPKKLIFLLHMHVKNQMVLLQRRVKIVAQKREIIAYVIPDPSRFSICMIQLFFNNVAALLNIFITLYNI